MGKRLEGKRSSRKNVSKAVAVGEIEMVESVMWRMMGWSAVFAKLSLVSFLRSRSSSSINDVVIAADKTLQSSYDFCTVLFFFLPRLIASHGTFHL